MAGSETGAASVYEALAAAVGRNPAATAIVFEGARMTFDELLRRSDDTAVRLRALGIGRGDAFAVFSLSRPDIMSCYYAAAKLGAVLVPINPNMTAGEVAHAIRHSGAKLLFHDEVVAEAARAATAGECRPLSDLSRPVPDEETAEEPRLEADDDFLIIYTSGSTGTPKAVVLDQAAQVGAARALSEMWGITSRDVTLVALPLGYLYGLSTACAVTLQAGGTVVILGRFRPGDVLDAMAEQRVTVFHGVPTMFTMMLEFVEQRGLRYDLSGTRALICAGAPLSRELKLRFARTFGKDIQNYYAMTESTPVFGVYASDPDPVPEDAIGRAAPDTTVRILGEGGRDCGAGQHGELFVRGPATMKRYHKEPEMTAASLADGLFRTGDIGYRDARGYYYIMGRIKDLIIRGGANISPAEVEAVLLRHPAVQDAAVVAAPDRIFGEVPVAFVVRRPGAEVTPEGLIAHAEGALADFKVPRQYRFEAELPLGKTGKVDKNALTARLRAIGA